MTIKYYAQFSSYEPKITKIEVRETPKQFKVLSYENVLGNTYLYIGRRIDKFTSKGFVCDSIEEAYNWLIKKQAYYISELETGMENARDKFAKLVDLAEEHKLSNSVGKEGQTICHY